MNYNHGKFNWFSFLLMKLYNINLYLPDCSMKSSCSSSGAPEAVVRLRGHWNRSIRSESTVWGRGMRLFAFPLCAISFFSLGGAKVGECERKTKTLCRTDNFLWSVFAERIREQSKPNDLNKIQTYPWNSTPHTVKKYAAPKYANKIKYVQRRFV